MNLCTWCGKPGTYYNHDGCTPAGEAQAEQDTADDPGPDAPEFL